MKVQLSIIYVYYNTPDEILDSIYSIKNAIGNIAYEIIIVDNNSYFPLPPEIKRDKRVTVIKNKINAGFGKGMNIGFKKSKGAYILLSNPDVLFTKKSISEMLSVMKQKSKTGIVGPRYTDSRGKRLRSFSGFPFLPGAVFSFSILNKIFPNNPFSARYWLSELDIGKEQEVDVVGGACMMIRSDLFEKVGGFDENFFMYFEESDLCLRIKKLGYKIVYYPKSEIVHLVGRSLTDKGKIEQYFESSRLYFFKKYHGLFAAYLGESLIRLIKPKSLFLVGILSFSTFMNLYKINDLMLFFGDAARDYLAARDMILTGVIPLVGIPSSVVWLHQGPLSIYLIGIAFLFSSFNPVAPGVFYALLGVVGVYLVYKLGQYYFNSSVGLLSAFFYATSPLVIINARMPYHTSSIPFFASLFFILLYRVISGEKKLLFIISLIYGLLLQVELSNIVLLPVILFVYLVSRKSIKFKDILFALLGFFIGTLPFILYDLKNHFVYSVGFPLWVLNRIRLFLGIAANRNGTIYHLPSGLETIVQQMSAVIFPSSILIFSLLVLFVIYQLIANRKVFMEDNIIKNKKNIILLWVVVPLFAYSIHASPGTAYFPLLFPAISLLIGFVVYNTSRKHKFIILVFFLLCFYNSFIMFKNDFFVTTYNKSNPLPPFSYNLGSSWVLSDEIVNEIIRDSDSRSFSIKGGGFFGTVATGVDTYKYLALWKRAKFDENAKLTYLIFDKTEKIPKLQKIFENKFTVVIKYEKK